MTAAQRIALGELIGRTRRQARLSPKQICDQTGLDVSTLVHAEFGDSVPPEQLHRLLDALVITSPLSRDVLDEVLAQGRVPPMTEAAARQLGWIAGFDEP